MYWYMSVDDMPVVAIYAEGIKNVVAYALIVTQQEIVAFSLMVGFLVSNEVSFECRHL